MSHVMSGGNQVWVPSTGFIYSGPGVKGQHPLEMEDEIPKEKLCEAWQQEAESEAWTLEESAKEQ